MDSPKSGGRIVFPDIEGHALNRDRLSDEGSSSNHKNDNSSSDSKSLKIENLQANQSKDQDFSLSYLESSFSSFSGENVGLNRNFAEKHSKKKRSDRTFMMKLMIVFVIFDIVFIAYLINLTFTTNIGFITNVSSLN